MDLSAADLNIILNSTNVDVLSIKTSAGDLDISGFVNSKYMEAFLIDTKAGDVTINLEGTTINEFKLKVQPVTLIYIISMLLTESSVLQAETF